MEGIMTDFMFAYATNIDAEEMHKHCPNAIFRGSGVLEGFKLVFSGYTGHAIATLKKQKGSSVNVIAWEMSPEDYYTIDNYEKFPYLYHKEKVSVVIMGRKIKGYIYLLKQKLQANAPDEKYLEMLRASFDKAGWSQDEINDALEMIKNEK